MTRFLDTFTDTLVPIKPYQILDTAGHNTLRELRRRNLAMYMGLRPGDIKEIQAIANEGGIREFCPEDLSRRFAGTEHTRAWLGKGRTMFQFRELGTGALAAYGCAGDKTCKEIPDQDTTLSLRASERFTGQGIGKLATLAIIAATTEIIGARNIGLKTWASNGAAVKTYLRSGATLVTSRDECRPTLYPAPNETDGMRRDVILFMSFGRTFRPADT